MEDFCDLAGCSDKMRKVHAWKWRHRRWHSHPIPTFVAWWEPTDRDKVSGASIGGRPEARRVWARRDEDRWRRHWYGLPTLIAWNTSYVLQAFEAWQQAGSPEPDEPFVSIAASSKAQAQHWRDLKPLIMQIGKPMPLAYENENRLALPEGGA